MQKILLVAYYPGPRKKQTTSCSVILLSVVLSHNIAIKLILTRLRYISCLKKYLAIFLIKSLHHDLFSYDPDWNFTPWSFSSSIKSSKSVNARPLTAMWCAIGFSMSIGWLRLLSLSLFFSQFSKTWVYRWILWHFVSTIRNVLDYQRRWHLNYFSPLLLVFVHI